MSDKNNVRVVRKSFYSTFRMHFATVIEREKKERKNELRSWIWSSRIVQSCRIRGAGGDTHFISFAGHLKFGQSENNSN